MPEKKDNDMSLEEEDLVTPENLRDNYMSEEEEYQMKGNKSLMSEEEDENSILISKEDDAFWKDYNYHFKGKQFMELKPHDVKRITFSDLYWYMD